MPNSSFFQFVTGSAAAISWIAGILMMVAGMQWAEVLTVLICSLILFVLTVDRIKPLG